jgi:hypothetical protein
MNSGPSSILATSTICITQHEGPTPRSGLFRQHGSEVGVAARRIAVVDELPGARGCSPDRPFPGHCTECRIRRAARAFFTGDIHRNCGYPASVAGTLLPVTVQRVLARDLHAWR